MTLGIAPIVYILIFVAVVVLVEGVYMLVFGKSITMDSRLSRRMALMDKTQNREEKVLEQLRKEMNQQLKSQGFPLFAFLEKKAKRANVDISPSRLILFMAGASVVAFIALTFATGAGLFVRAGIGAAIGFGGVFFWINGKAKKRMIRLEEQLPDAVELMVRSLRVGHPLSSAIGIVAKEVADPLGTEFSVIADEATYGRNIAESLKAFAERMDNQDLRFLSVAVNIQQASGGNLAEILDGLGKVIRARFKLFRRVKAITAEAKWSGMILSGFPIGALLMILMVKPNYYDDVMQTSSFVPACIFVATFLVINIVFMKVMTNIKV